MTDASKFKQLLIKQRFHLPIVIVPQICIICDIFEAGNKLDKALFPPFRKRIEFSVIEV
jgi:hypothetical protein